jgi:prepilin-type N-terminal cleavage/methylation domain-containing protein
MSLYTKKNLPVIKKSRNTRAFSLVEMIVSMAIFSIVAVIALGALTKIIASNRKAQSLQSSITNLNFMLDSMSRELRVGAYYQCDTISPTNSDYKGEDFLITTPCSDPSFDISSADNQSVALAFKTAREAQISGGTGTCSLANAYRFRKDSDNVWHLEKAIQKSCEYGIASGDFMDVVDPNVTITDWYLKVATKYDNDSSIEHDSTFPLVTISISGYSGIRERDKTYFSVQTAVSPRVNNF